MSSRNEVTKARIKWDTRLDEPTCDNCLLKVQPEKRDDGRLTDPTHCPLCGSEFTNAIR